MSMRVAFYKVDDGRLCAWTALIPKRRPLQGTTMAAGRDLPHDLAQFVVESSLGLWYGFRGLVSMGGIFESVRRGATKPGGQVIRTHHAALVATERVVNAHAAAWRAQAATPVGPALDEMLARWRSLRAGEELRVEWTISPAAGRPQRAPASVASASGTSCHSVSLSAGAPHRG